MANAILSAFLGHRFDQRVEGFERDGFEDFGGQDDRDVDIPFGCFDGGDGVHMQSGAVKDCDTVYTFRLWIDRVTKAAECVGLGASQIIAFFADTFDQTSGDAFLGDALVFVKDLDLECCTWSGFEFRCFDLWYTIPLCVCRAWCDRSSYFLRGFRSRKLDP